MTAEFYLFDIGVGQSAALKLPNGKWCLFDMGKSDEFSPVNWIISRNRTNALFGTILTGVSSPSFRFHKSTISHFHGDHLGDAMSLFQTGTDYFRTVNYDQLYINDCYSTCSYESKAMVTTVVNHIGRTFGTQTVYPDYGGAMIGKLSLPASVARGLGGTANSKVNNASVVTRIDIYGNSILICGDIEKEAWEAIINDNGEYGKNWRPFVSNVDILIAPHHGHESGYSVDLLNLAKPAVVLVSVQSKNPNVASRYSQEPVRGIKIGNDSFGYISTRQKGHIKISIEPSKTILGKGARNWSFGDNALN